MEVFKLMDKYKIKGYQQSDSIYLIHQEHSAQLTLFREIAKEEVDNHGLKKTY